MNRIRIASVLGMVILAAGAALYLTKDADDAQTLDDLGPAPLFRLVDQSGLPFDSASLSGRVWIGNFIYTHCTDTCPGLTAKMQRIQRLIANDPGTRDRLALISFTTDPGRDTPAVLREYGERFGADFSGWTFLTSGTDDVLDVIIGGFHLGVTTGPSVREEPGAGGPEGEYDVFHSNRFVIVDQDGTIRAYPDGIEAEAEEILALARSLL